MEFSLDACTEEYKGRFLAHYDELKWLYCKLDEGRLDFIK